jgi:ketosteroid isomerase-like protein
VIIVTRPGTGRQAGWTKEAGMLRKLWLGVVLAAGAVAVGALTVALSACGGSSSAVDSELQEQVDRFLISEIEKDFHESMSKKDLDQMMGLWTENATFTVGGATATGKAEIRAFWAKSPAFESDVKWVSDHPAYKLRATVNGDRGTLHFECHFLDVEDETVALVTAADQEVERIDGRWLITSMVGGTTTLSP